jgi:hypothetical protein
MEDVARAIEALHNSFSPEHSKEASVWLNSFAEASEAWEISLALLEPSRPASVQFFVANLLLTKARREWGQLPHNSRSRISAAVRQALRKDQS